MVEVDHDWHCLCSWQQAACGQRQADFFVAGADDAEEVLEVLSDALALDALESVLVVVELAGESVALSDLVSDADGLDALLRDDVA